MLVHFHNQLAQLSNACFLVCLRLPGLVCLNHETGRLFGMIAGRQNTFVEGRRKQREELVGSDAQLSFGIDSGAAVR